MASLHARLNRKIIARLNKAVQWVSSHVINTCDQCLMGVGGHSFIEKLPRIESLLKLYADLLRLLQDSLGITAYKLANDRWKIVFLGPEKGLRQFRSQFFEDSCQCETLGRFTIFRIRKALPRWLEDEAELVVCEASPLMGWFLKADLALQAPLWFEMLLPLPGDPETLLTGKKRSAIRNKINRFLRSGYGYTFDSCEKAFKDFYQHMYVPFITSRHKELTCVTPEGTQYEWWKDKGGVLQVCLHGEPVAGTICYVDQGTCYAIETGVKESGENHFTRGIFDFSLWCIICWSSEQGAKCLNLGGTRPFRTNGSYLHKTQWGALPAVRRRSVGMWHFLAQHIEPALVDHLNGLQLICQKDNKLWGILFDDIADRNKTDRINQALDLARHEGLAGLVWAASKRPVWLSEPLPCPNDPHLTLEN